MIGWPAFIGIRGMSEFTVLEVRNKSDASKLTALFTGLVRDLSLAKDKSKGYRR